MSPADPTPEEITDRVTDLRRTLMNAHRAWQATAAQPLTDEPAVASAGYAMASSYAYVLAAVLHLAYQADPKLAYGLTSAAEALFNDGDHDDLNGDLAPDLATTAPEASNR